MALKLRPIENFIATRPRDESFRVDTYLDYPSSEFVWFRLRELSEGGVPWGGVILG